MINIYIVGTGDFLKIVRVTNDKKTLAEAKTKMDQINLFETLKDYTGQDCILKFLDLKTFKSSVGSGFIHRVADGIDVRQYTPIPRNIS